MINWIFFYLFLFSLGALMSHGTHKFFAWNRVRPRRIRKKHRDLIQKALELTSKEFDVIAYTIEKSWDFYTGEWEGFIFRILVDDVNRHSKRIEMEIKIFDLIDTDVRFEMFYLISVDAFVAENFNVYKNEKWYECHRVLTDIKVVL